MSKKVIIENFWMFEYNGTKDLTEDQIGWDKDDIANAMSDDPETIFRYYVDTVGLNIAFYWLKDRNFYTIETELMPVEVRRIYANPNWDGKTEFNKAGEDGVPDTSSAGEILATFDDETRIWDELKIDGVGIGDVLKESVIVKMD